MRRRVQGGWIIMGMAVLGATIAGGREARAALTGITITGGYTPTSGDPPYEYIYDMYLNPGFSVVHLSSITVDDVIGVTPASAPSAVQPADWVVSISQTGPNPSSDVTWTFDGTEGIDNVSGQEALFLGEFSIVTVKNYPNGPPVPAGTIVDYSYTVTDSSGQPFSGTGSFGIASVAVPEPSSAAIVVLMVGTAGFSGLIVRRRRARAA